MNKTYVRRSRGPAPGTWVDELSPGGKPVRRFVPDSLDQHRCEAGVCIGCGGSGKHPYAGQRGDHDGERDYVASDEKCSWCGGSGTCPDDPTHLPEHGRS